MTVIILYNVFIIKKMDQWGILKGGKYFNVYAVGFITTTQNKNTELLICVLVIFMHCKNKT